LLQSPSVRVTTRVTLTVRLIAVSTAPLHADSLRGGLGLAASLLSAVVDICIFVVVWPGGVEFELDELDDAARRELTDDEDRAQKDAADHQDPVVVPAGHEPGRSSHPVANLVKIGTSSWN
jgi:hypothetical protein